MIPSHHETLVLEAFQYGYQSKLHKEMLREENSRLEVQDMGDHVLAQIVFTVYGQKHGEETVSFHSRYPSDWWQHFKQRWFPRWALRRWPVRLKHDLQEVTLSKYTFYPQVVASSPSHRVIADPSPRRVWTDK